MNQYNILWGVLLGLLGFAGNCFKLELFFNVDFIFGTIFVLLATARYGAIPGIVTSLMAGSCTWLLWHHPWALIICVAEAAVVGIIIRRRTVSLLAADTLFWLCCGTPLVWLFYHHIMGIPGQLSLLIVLKQSLNGISNAVLAQVILLALQSYHAESDQLPRFRQINFTVMVSLVLSIGMTVLVTDLRGIMKRQLQDLVDNAEHTSLIASTSIYATLQQQLQSVIALAQLVGDPSGKSTDELQKLVTLVNLVVPAYHKMGILDRTSRTIAYNPPIDENGHSNVGVDFSDRYFIPILKENLKPYIPDIVMGRLGNNIPRAIMLAPIIVNGQYGGFCVGVIDLDMIQNLLKTQAGSHSMHITLVDRKEQVVTSTRSDLKTMSHFEFGDGEKRQVRPGVIQWIPRMPPGSSVMERWRHSGIIAERQLDKELPWKIVVEMSPVKLMEILTNKSIFDMSLLLAVFLLSALIAAVLSRIFLKPLENLQKIAEELPGLIPDIPPKTRWPVSRMFELDSLTTNFRKMAAMLADKFIQLESTYRELAQETEKHRQLELQIEQIREQVEQDERRRISRDLHDGLGQSLQAVKLNLQIMKTRCNKGCGYDGQMIDDAIFEIGATSEELRDIIAMLRPPVPADRSLSEALEWLADRLSRRSGVNIKIIRKDVPEELTEELKSGLFRICQEALSNALRHGNPTAVEVNISCSGNRLSLTVHDDGCGFDPYSCSSGFGIGIMKERASLMGGVFKLKSYPGQGTGIDLEVTLS